MTGRPHLDAGLCATRPACLNEFEHRVLKESFRQARRLQQQMKTAFNLEA
jgi:hypothetical protein